MVTSPRPGESILDRLVYHARNGPDQLAYCFLHDDQGSDTLTFGQLDQRVRGLAARLQEYATSGDRALLLFPPGLAFIEAFLACLAASLVAVPAYPPRENRNGDRLRGIVDDARPRLILTTQQTVPAIKTHEIGTVQDLILLTTDDTEAPASASWPMPEVGVDTVAFLQYTSGSTGTPRGVVITHGNMACNEQQIQASFRHTRASVGISWLPHFHDMGLIGGVLQPLYVGFPGILLSHVSFQRQPVRWLQAITEHKGTTSGAPNFAYDYCVKYINDEQKQNLDLSSWTVAFNGAEPVRADTMDRFTEAFACCGFRPEAFFPCYGLAESTLFVSGGPPGQRPNRLRLCGPLFQKDRVASAKSICTTPAQCTSRCAQVRNGHISDGPRITRADLVSSGRIAEGTRAVIVDPDAGRECPPGRIGEIWLHSGCVARGYWNHPEETRKHYRAYRADTGEGPFLRTGDTGFIQGDELFLTGRLKDLVIIRGRNFYPQDIEAAVERVVPFARANGLAAFSVEVDGRERLALAIEADRALVQKARAVARLRDSAAPHRSPATQGPTAELDALVSRVRRCVSEEFELRVHIVAFVRPGSFPRTSSGKVQRWVCRAGLLAGTLDLVHAWPRRILRPQDQKG